MWVQPHLCRMCNGHSLADLQQFFTGKLYVLVQQLKLPAEELLWLALSCAGDPSVCLSDSRNPTSIVVSDHRCMTALLLVWRVHVLRFKAMTPAVSCNKKLFRIKLVAHPNHFGSLFNEFWCIYVPRFSLLPYNVYFMLSMLSARFT